MFHQYLLPFYFPLPLVPIVLCGHALPRETPVSHAKQLSVNAVGTTWKLGGPWDESPQVMLKSVMEQ